MKIISDELAKEWKLSSKLTKAFDTRESTMCLKCGSSLRSNLQAKAICNIIFSGSSSIQDFTSSSSAKVKNFSIAEINSCGAMHQYLAKIKNLSYSEYLPQDSITRKEDLQDLTYKDSSFDYVLTSETLEHIPDWKKAAEEIHRVLKKGGMHIFTVPVVPTRNTRYRTKIIAGKEKKLLPDSFHGCSQEKIASDYLVRTEFGIDFFKELDLIGFETKIYYRNMAHLYDPSFVLVSTKV